MSSRVYFLISIGALLFVGGFTLAFMKLPPYELAVSMRAQIADWKEFPSHYLRIRPDKFLAPADRVPKGLPTHALPEASAGQTFMTGFFDGRPALRLVGMNGELLHTWNVVYTDVFPSAKHVQNVPRHVWDTHLHGAVLYPNGDVVFNFEDGGLVRMDQCSRVKWAVPRQTHHSVHLDEQGNLWVPARTMRTKRNAAYPNAPTPPYWEDSVLEVSPDGKILREISLLEAIFSAHHESVLFASGEHHLEVAMPDDRDFTHLNDVEVLSSAMAPAFPMFKAGDLMISLRNVNLLLVLDPQSRAIKWTMTGPFLRQHDPDFEANGQILVFDNNRDSRTGRVRGGSRVLAIDPVTRAVTPQYGGRPDEFFYTGRMGAQQRLPNGNLLVTVSEAGFVIEVTPAHQIVWSFVNRWSPDSVALIERATRYPESYFNVSGKRNCS